LDIVTAFSLPLPFGSSAKGGGVSIDGDVTLERGNPDLNSADDFELVRRTIVGLFFLVDAINAWLFFFPFFSGFDICGSVDAGSTIPCEFVLIEEASTSSSASISELAGDAKPTEGRGPDGGGASAFLSIGGNGETAGILDVDTDDVVLGLLSPCAIVGLALEDPPSVLAVF